MYDKVASIQAVHCGHITPQKRFFTLKCEGVSINERESPPTTPITQGLLNSASSPAIQISLSKSSNRLDVMGFKVTEYFEIPLSENRLFDFGRQQLSEIKLSSNFPTKMEFLWLQRTLILNALQRVNRMNGQFKTGVACICMKNRSACAMRES